MEQLEALGVIVHDASHSVQEERALFVLVLGRRAEYVWLRDDGIPGSPRGAPLAATSPPGSV